MIKLIFIVLMAIFWRLGGGNLGKIPGSHFYRWIGAPIIMLLFSMLIGIVWWKALIIAGALYGVSTLPITLKGDEDSENILWFPILGLAYSTPAVLSHIFTDWHISLIAGVLISLGFNALKFLELTKKLNRVWVELLTGCLIIVLI